MIYLLLIVSFLPLVLILAIRKRGTSVAKPLNGNKVKWLFGAYVIILFISTVTFFMLPKQTHTNYQVLTPKEQQQAVVDDQSLFHHLSNGHVEEISKDQLEKQWSFNLDESELTVDVRRLSGQSIIVFVEKSKDMMQSVEAFYVSSRKIIDGVDVSSEINEPELLLEGNTLIVQRDHQHVEIQFVKYTKEFTITQFSGDPKNMMENTMVGGVNYLYLRVPEDSKIIGNVDLVEKNKK